MALAVRLAMRDGLRLPSLLVRLAATVAAGSGCTVSHGSCDGYVSSQQDISVTPAVACAIAAQGGITATSGFTSGLSGKACSDACGPGYGTCDLPADYVKAYQSASTSADAGGDAGATTCPAVTGTVKVHCASYPCEGRRTEGIDEPRALNDAGLGAHFAAASYLEAVSVHAFERLRFELSSHDAPDELIALVRRAEADEVRHAELTEGLARRFGVVPEIPMGVSAEPRGLFAIALENAVEGCVRETYGAAVACFRALRARDESVRATMETIARDECEHAELGFRIAEWALPRLDRDQRDAIQAAMRDAMQDLSHHLDDRLDESDRAVCGSPSPEERRRLLQLIDRDVLAAESPVALPPA